MNEDSRRWGGIRCQMSLLVCFNSKKGCLWSSSFFAYVKQAWSAPLFGANIGAVLCCPKSRTEMSSILRLEIAFASQVNEFIRLRCGRHVLLVISQLIKVELVGSSGCYVDFSDCLEWRKGGWFIGWTALNWTATRLDRRRTDTSCVFVLNGVSGWANEEMETVPTKTWVLQMIGF